MQCKGIRCGVQSLPSLCMTLNMSALGLVRITQRRTSALFVLQVTIAVVEDWERGYTGVGRVWLARQHGTIPAVGCSRRRMRSWPSVDTWHSLLHRAVQRKRGEKYSQLLGGHQLELVRTQAHAWILLMCVCVKRRAVYWLQSHSLIRELSN